MISKKYNIGTGPILREVEKQVKKVSNDEIVVDVQTLNRKMHMVTNVRKRQEQYIIALLLSKNKSIQDKIFANIKPEDINDTNTRKLYEFIINLSKSFDINKIDILSKLQDDKLIKDFTDIMYIEISNVDKVKLLNDVLKNKNKEKLYLRRDEILKRLNENITIDEEEVLKLELNQIIVQLSKLK